MQCVQIVETQKKEIVFLDVQSVEKFVAQIVYNIVVGMAHAHNVVMDIFHIAMK